MFDSILFKKKLSKNMQKALPILLIIIIVISGIYYY